MDRVVLDTNVVVSGLINPSGPPGRILDLILGRKAEAFVSPAVIDEYGSVLRRARLSLAPGRIDAFMTDLQGVAIEVTPRDRVRVCSDPADDMFIECAFASGAGFVITGNLRHFPAEFAGIRVLAPAAYLRLLGA